MKSSPAAQNPVGTHAAALGGIAPGPQRPVQQCMYHMHYSIIKTRPQLRCYMQLLITAGHIRVHEQLRRLQLAIMSVQELRKLLLEHLPLLCIAH